jgi:hypothetical protein
MEIEVISVVCCADAVNRGNLINVCKINKKGDIKLK